MYNKKQYDAARDFVKGGSNNVSDPLDNLRIQTYDLYEDIYLNSTFQLSIILRGQDQTPILIPTGKKLVEATHRFLGVNVNYLVEGEGDSGTQSDLDKWFKNWFKREAFKSKFESTKRWGLIRGDALLMVYTDPTKESGSRISIAEIDPRQAFQIEDANGAICGWHIVDCVRDFRASKENQKSAQLARRRTFRKALDEEGFVIKDSPVTTELTYWELKKWDDRTEESREEMEQVHGGPDEQEPTELGSKQNKITTLPIYQWMNSPMQNTTWGTSQLAGLETLMYAVNQSITDEDCTIVFQGLGMYWTDAAPPIDPNTGAQCDWNIGPMQIIETGMGNKFERVSGVSSVSPYQDHMNWMDEKGMAESSGIPEVAIGRVDVQAAESGISLKLQFMPLLAQNSEKELHLINLLDQLFYDITSQWLPAYEPEMFGNAATMKQMSVVCLFDDPMPVDRAAVVQETVLLRTNNLILTSMAVAKLRSLGWQYPSVSPDGQPLSDDDIAQMLSDQATQDASAADPFATQAASDLASYDAVTGTPPGPGNLGAPTPPKKQTFALNGS